MKLAKIKQIDLRDVWRHEALEFTTWLAKEENLSLLSDEIGIEISLIQTEASVGKFNVDILAKEENTGRKIVIENQLESTNHDHLGKLITYASGFDAEIVIWIVKDVRDEHKQAIVWLNEHTDEQVNFFVIKMEVWQISDSPLAPKFQVIAQPNEWAKAVKTSSIQTDLSDTKLMQLDFWTDFRRFGQQNSSKLRFRKPSPQHWYDISIGSSKAHVALVCDTQNNQLRCELYIPRDKELFKRLEFFKEDIASQLDYDLDWMLLENKKASRIRTIAKADIANTFEWEQQFSWLIQAAENFQQIFSKFIAKIERTIE